MKEKSLLPSLLVCWKGTAIGGGGMNFNEVYELNELKINIIM
jgi:hypothetical protein